MRKDGFPYVSAAIMIILAVFFAVLIHPLTEQAEWQPASLYYQAVANCPNGWELNKYCTEEIYNYTCRNDGKNYTYVCKEV